MNTHHYLVRWLLPEDAPEVAALEATIHVTEHRAGEDLIEEQLEVTECEGRNLSLGLYWRDPGAPSALELVGFGLAFLMQNRREMADFFDAPLPADLNPDEPLLYIADWAVLPEHRRATALMGERFVATVRGHDELRGLAINAFSTPEYAEKWSARTKFVARMGWQLAGRYPFHDAKLKRPMFWMHFTPLPAVTARPATDTRLTCRMITELRDWADLKVRWDRLLESSPDHTPWQSYAFLTHWWRHLSQGAPLRVVVVERGGVPCLVLPLQIATWDAVPLAPVRLLEPIGMIMDVNRPRLALGLFDEAAYRCAFDFLWSREDWHVIRVDEKPWHDAEMALLRDYALERGCIFRQVFSHLVPYLDLRQSWTSFIARRSQKLRKNLKAARRKLEEQGPVRLEVYGEDEDLLEALDIVLELHARSWKRQDKVEHSRSTGYPAFFSAWVQHMARQDRCRILVLYCGATPVAATVAFIDGDIYHSAQILHDARFNSGSPGTLLEAMELEHLMNEGRFATYDMLGSFLANKMRWTDTAMKSAHTLVLRRHVRTFLMDGYFFLLKPYLRPALVALHEKLQKRLRPRKP